MRGDRSLDYFSLLLLFLYFKTFFYESNGYMVVFSPDNLID